MKGIQVANVPRKGKQQIIQFGGYNLTDSQKDGDLVDMTNLSSKNYPALSPRKSREMVSQLVSSQNVFVHNDKLAYISNNKLYYDGEAVGDVSPGEKSIASINDYIVIMPDKKHYDTANKEFKDMELHLEQTNILIESSVKAEGSSWPASVYGQMVCTVVFNHDMKSYFKKGDVIKITGTKGGINDRSAFIKDFYSNNCVIFDENTFRPTEDTEEGKKLMVERIVPDMTFICEYENRLWGCNDKSEIFASKLGDHTEFNYFAGLQNDSYGASVGTDGKFTGVYNFNNMLLFFKEDVIHKVYGNKPKAFQLITHKTKGVQKGCHKSLCVANDILFYKSRSGVVGYNGSVPMIVSQNFGDYDWSEAVAGTDGLIYYLSMKNDLTNQYKLFTFDAVTDLWHIQDNSKVVSFANIQTELYFIDDTAKLWKVDSGNEVVKWSAVFAPMHEYAAEKKIHSKLQFITDIKPGNMIEFQISYDGGDFTSLGVMDGAGLRTDFYLIKPRRCEYFQIKVIGTGEAKIKSIIREMRTGSDV